MVSGPVNWTEHPKELIPLFAAASFSMMNLFPRPNNDEIDFDLYFEYQATLKNTGFLPVECQIFAALPDFKDRLELLRERAYGISLRHGYHTDLMLKDFEKWRASTTES